MGIADSKQIAARGSLINVDKHLSNVVMTHRILDDVACGGEGEVGVGGSWIGRKGNFTC